MSFRIDTQYLCLLGQMETYTLGTVISQQLYRSSYLYTPLVMVSPPVLYFGCILYSFISYG